MKLATKFNLTLCGVFAVGMVAAGLISYYKLQSHAREQVVANARIMMETALAMRAYTITYIQPMATENFSQMDVFFVRLDRWIQDLSARVTSQEGQDFQAIASQIVAAGRTRLKEVSDGVFHPQTVPAFAATESFNYIRKQYPQYTYKEAALNPTNPRDRAVPWEEEIIQKFRSGGGETELVSERVLSYGEERTLYLAKPIKVGNEACLQCHSTPDKAPVAMIKRYGSEHGFGWKNGEIIGAQVVTVPMSLPISIAKESFQTLMALLAIVFLAILIGLNIALRYTVIKPVVALSNMADKISMGDLSTPHVNAKGNDEISALSASFGRMRRSLEKALKMLE